MKKRILVIIMLIFAISFCFVGCDNENNKNSNTSNQEQSNTVKVTGISLNFTSQTLTVGSDITLRATVSPTNATNKNVTFSSNNISVATVSDAGKILGISKGTATITVKTVDGGYKATCVITIIERDGSPTLPDV